MAPPTGFTVLSGPTIAANQSLSDALDVSAGRIFRLGMPDEWTKADLTFQVSADGTKFFELFDENGIAISLPCVQKSIVAFRSLLYITSIKIRSGTYRHPIEQPSARVFTVMLDTRTTTLQDTRSL